MYLRFTGLPTHQSNNDKLLELLDFSNSCSLFIGDFNLPSIDWKFETASKRFGRLFLEKSETNNLQQLIDFPTHLRGNTLDLLLINNPELVLDIENCGNVGNRPMQRL